jgi:DNA-directed RNA polymerase specialized sigma24 family protein
MENPGENTGPVAPFNNAINIDLAFGGAGFGDAGSCDAEMLALDATLEELAHLNPRQAKVVEGRFFGGLNVAETAEVLGVSESVVERDWRAARAWLAGKIRPDRE